MQIAPPQKVLISGGHEVGGLTAFAMGLSEGFRALGIPSEVVPSGRILHRWRDLRDPQVLKILSTSALSSAPFAHRAICVAHGLFGAAYQGWTKALGLFCSFKLAQLSGAALVAVSHYSAIHLRAMFDLRVDAVVHNPLQPLFLEPMASGAETRNSITYVGRLHVVKNLHRLLPVIRALLRETPGLRVCIIGEGEQRAALEEIAGGDPAFHFTGLLDSIGVRDWLRRTRVFISGCEVEALGISYLEALSQGCAVVMPASGGGLEVALNQIGKAVHLLPLSFDPDEVLSVLRRALQSDCSAIPMSAYRAEVVAEAYLRVDSRFSAHGTFARQGFAIQEGI